MIAIYILRFFQKNVFTSINEFFVVVNLLRKFLLIKIEN